MADDKHSSLVTRLGAMVTDMEARSLGVETGLSETLRCAVRQVPGSQYAGITVAHHRDGIATAAATHAYPELLDEIQQRHQDGPGVTAAWEHHTVHITDLASDERWPRYRRDALKQTPIRSILSFELFVNPQTTGALNFFADEPHAFGHESVETGLVVATHTALSWLMLRRGEQFRNALASRDVIGQAKGLIMERYNVDTVAAFDLLRRLARSSNAPLAKIAEDLVSVASAENGRTAAR